MLLRCGLKKVEDKMDVYEAIVNVNTVLILLAAGAFVWVVRQIVPDNVEKTKVWRTVLRVLPVVAGGGIALIPGLRPMENVAQSIVVGGIAGSFSSTIYELAREVLGQKIKAVLGSPQARRTSLIPPEPEAKTEEKK